MTEQQWTQGVRIYRYLILLACSRDAEKIRFQISEDQNLLTVACSFDGRVFSENTLPDLIRPLDLDASIDNIVIVSGKWVSKAKRGDTTSTHVPGQVAQTTTSVSIHMKAPEGTADEMLKVFNKFAPYVDPKKIIVELLGETIKQTNPSYRVKTRYGDLGWTSPLAGSILLRTSGMPAINSTPVNDDLADVALLDVSDSEASLGTLPYMFPALAWQFELLSGIRHYAFNQSSKLKARMEDPKPKPTAVGALEIVLPVPAKSIAFSGMPENFHVMLPEDYGDSIKEFVKNPANQKLAKRWMIANIIAANSINEIFIENDDDPPIKVKDSYLVFDQQPVMFGLSTFTHRFSPDGYTIVFHEPVQVKMVELVTVAAMGLSQLLELSPVTSASAVLASVNYVKQKDKSRSK